MDCCRHSPSVPVPQIMVGSNIFSLTPSFPDSLNSPGRPPTLDSAQIQAEDRKGTQPDGPVGDGEEWE